LEELFMGEARELTFGEDLVGLNFNPANNPEVQKLKELAAEMIDIVEKVRGDRTAAAYTDNLIDGEAIRRILGAQMWAVKSVTRGL
jgi:hypothetical protein